MWLQIVQFKEVQDEASVASTQSPPKVNKRRFKIKNIDRHGDLRGAILKVSTSDMDQLEIDSSKKVIV